MGNKHLEKYPYNGAAVSLVTVPEQVRAGDSQCHWLLPNVFLVFRRLMPENGKVGCGLHQSLDPRHPRWRILGGLTSCLGDGAREDGIGTSQ